MEPDYQYYNKFLDKIKKSTNYDEIMCLYEIFKKSVSNPIELELITSLLDKKFFVKKISVDKFCLFLNRIYTTNNIEELDSLIKDMKKLTDDNAQLYTIDKLLNIKKFVLPLNLNDNNRIKIKKNCPHCNNVNIEEDGTTYTICGYSYSGYDWKGCGNDWCFKCGKKLCKCWHLDQLFNKFNRFHDKHCCKSHANKHNCRYPEDYCQCNNMYVYRQ